MYDINIGTFALHLDTQIHFRAWYIGACYSFMIVMSLNQKLNP